MQLDFQAIMALDTYYRATLINKLSGPKSGNLIGTTSNSGTTNLAIFNSVIHIGANPPYLGFLLRPLTVERHTYNNIKETGQFTINQLHMGIHQAGHQTSAKYPESVSEFEACGLTEEYVGNFRAPFVKESRVKLGLTFVEEQLIKTNARCHRVAVPA